MKRIPCRDLDSLKGTETYGKLLVHLGKYKKRSALSSLVGIIFAPFFILVVAQAYLIVFGISTVVGHLLRQALTPSMGGVLSGAASETIINGMFWIAEAFILVPFLIAAFAFVLLFYYSARSLASGRPNVAKALYLVDSLEEAEQITLPNKASAAAYGAFSGLWNRYLRMSGSGSVEELSRQAYANGGVISKTAAKTLAFTAASSHPSSSGRLRIELEEHGELVSMVVLMGTGGSADWLPEVIAVFEKKYREEVVGKIASCCPNAIIA
jgi:hypothetical protein